MGSTRTLDVTRERPGSCDPWPRSQAPVLRLEVPVSRLLRSRRVRIISVLALVAVLAAVGLALRARQKPSTVVQTEEVRRGEVVESVSATGRVQPQSEVKISANVSGRVVSLGVAESDSVAPGELLVEIDPTRYQALVLEVEAGLRSARAEERLAAANLAQAAREHDRIQRMHGEGLTSAGDLENAETTRQVAAARLDAAREAVHRAEALLAQARDDRAKTTILAPIAGNVTQLNVEVGEMVLGTAQNVGTTIMAIADLNRMEVLAEVDESEVVKVSLGDSATVDVDALSGQVFHGIVSEIANSGTTRGRGTAEETTHFEVKVAVVGDVRSLRPGMSASVDVLTDRRVAVLSVPIQCVTLRAKPEEGAAGVPAASGDRPGPGEVAEAEAGTPRRKPSAAGAGGLGLAGNLREVVYVVRDGIARELAVRTGISSPTHIEILAGELEEGDEVVSGNYRVLSRELEDGARVKVDNASLRRGGREDGRESRAAASGGGNRDHG